MLKTRILWWYAYLKLPFDAFSIKKETNTHNVLVDQYMYSKMQITAEQKNLYAILWLTVDKSSNIKYARATKSNTHSINNMISILSFVIWCMAKLEDTALGRDKLSSLPNVKSGICKREICNDWHRIICVWLKRQKWHGSFKWPIATL